MESLILRVSTPLLTVMMVVFSIFVLLRGHNEPGGGFIGGLIGVAALATYGIAAGTQAVRQALVIPPLSLAGLGLFLAALSGILSALGGKSFLTGLWGKIPLGTIDIKLGTPMLFDLGVYFVVVGAISSIALDVEEEG